MEKLEFKITIETPAKVLWETMLNLVTYKEWVNESWPGSYYEGEWKKGEEMRFLGTQGGGTLAKIDELVPYQQVLATHIGIIGADGSIDTSSDIAKGWIGTNEKYTFTERNGKTELKVEMNTNPSWASMFKDGWPGALKKLKKIAEHRSSKA